MIKCISFFEETWLVRNSDRQQWNHLVNAFECSFELYDLNGFVWDDAEHNPDGLPVYVFDETGERSLLTPDEFQHPIDAIYVFGITGTDVTKVVPDESTTETIRVDTPQAVSLWGVETAAIALGHRYLQSLS